MIQRIQSLYLLLTSLLTLLFLKVNFLKFFNNSGSEILMNFKGIWQITEQGQTEIIQRQIPLSAIIILIPVISLTALFLYKSRKLQLRLTLTLIFLAAILLIYLLFFSVLIINRYGMQFTPSLSMAIPPLVLLLGLLAYRGIKRDEDIVRSYDRLR